MEDRDKSMKSADHKEKYLMCFVPDNLNLLHGVLRFLAEEMEVHDDRVVVLSTDEEGQETRLVVLFKISKSYTFENAFCVTVGEKPFEFHLIQTNSKSKHRIFYTLNALNGLIAKETGVPIDQVDKSHQIHWEEYKQNIIYTVQKDNLKIIPTMLEGVVNLKPMFSLPQRERNEPSGE